MPSVAFPGMQSSPLALRRHGDGDRPRTTAVRGFLGTRRQRALTARGQHSDGCTCSEVSPTKPGPEKGAGPGPGRGPRTPRPTGQAGVAYSLLPDPLEASS